MQTLAQDTVININTRCWNFDDFLRDYTDKFTLSWACPQFVCAVFIFVPLMIIQYS